MENKQHIVIPLLRIFDTRENFPLNMLVIDPFGNKLLFAEDLKK
jgi:hypothetical protein